MDEHMKEQLGRAIALATANQGADEDEAGAREAQLLMIRQYIEEDPGFEANILFAALNLVTILLVKLEKATDRTGTEILQEIARRYTT